MENKWNPHWFHCILGGNIILIVEPVEVVARIVWRKLAWPESPLQRTGTCKHLGPVITGIASVGTVIIVLIPTLMSVGWPGISV